MIYGIDFDGTIVEEKFPAIGRPIATVVDFIRDLQARGDKWVLITMREGKPLDDAVAWMKSHGLKPDAINDNLPDRIEKWGNNPRKVYADIYIDDHNAGGVQLPGFWVLPELQELRYIVEQFKKWSAEGGCPISYNPDFPCWWNEHRFDEDCTGYCTYEDEAMHGCWVEYYRWKFQQMDRKKEVKNENNA